MAKRRRKYQHAHRVRSDNADSVVYGLPEPPEVTAERVDGRYRTRVMPTGSRRDTRREAETKAIREQQ